MNNNEENSMENEALDELADVGVDGKKVTTGKNKGGRPRKKKVELISVQDRRAMLNLESYLKDITKDINKLRDMTNDSAISNAQVNGMSKVINANLRLVDKLVPDLKTVEVVGEIGHQHDHKHHVNVDNLELAKRLQFWRSENQNLLNTVDAESNVIDRVKMPSSRLSSDIYPERVVPEGSENPETLATTNLSAPEPEYDFL